MRTLSFIIEGQKIKKDPDCDFSGLVGGTAGYLRAKFTFDKEWDDYKKVASFFDERGREKGMLIISGECEIPAQATAGTKFEVSVLGAKKDRRIRTGRVTIRQGR